MTDENTAQLDPDEIIAGEQKIRTDLLEHFLREQGYEVKRQGNRLRAQKEGKSLDVAFSRRKIEQVYYGGVERLRSERADAVKRYGFYVEKELTQKVVETKEKPSTKQQHEKELEAVMTEPSTPTAPEK